MRHKTALILSGGGMTCTYSVGVLMALAKHYGFTKPDIAIAGSGNAGTLAYYVAGQYDDIAYSWSNLLTGRKLINLWRFWKILDIDYLVDTVFKKIRPLNVEAIFKSKTHYLIPVPNAFTGSLHYFSNRQKIDIFEALKATKAMPLAFGKRIRIHDEDFVDSYASSSTTLHIAKAMKMGADKIIVIDNTRRNRLNETLFTLWSKMRNQLFKHNYRNHVEKMKQFIVPTDKDVFVITPKQQLSINTFNSDPKDVRKTINQGFSEALENTELATFLNSIQ